jgi:hypothetical protein
MRAHRIGLLKTVSRGDAEGAERGRDGYAVAVTEQQIPFIVIGASILVAAVSLVVISKKSSALSARLAALVTTFGWEAPQRVWWNGAIRGRWQGVDVELRHMGRYKSMPERLQLTIKTSSPARVIVKRRTDTFLSKPLTLFGPPLIEPMNVADRERYWVRSDELVYAERLFAHAEVAPALEPNLIARFDSVDLRRDQLRILRAIDERSVKKHFNRPMIKFGRDYDLIETIAKEEWRLATVIVQALGLRGYERG